MNSAPRRAVEIAEARRPKTRWGAARRALAASGSRSPRWGSERRCCSPATFLPVLRISVDDEVITARPHRLGRARRGAARARGVRPDPRSRPALHGSRPAAARDRARRHCRAGNSDRLRPARRRRHRRGRQPARGRRGRHRPRRLRRGARRRAAARGRRNLSRSRNGRDEDALRCRSREVSGTGWSTSQRSTIRPSASKRKMSMPAYRGRRGQCWKQCRTTSRPPRPPA